MDSDNLVHLDKLLNFSFFSQGQYVKMACSRLGSRVLEAIWNSASVSHRQSIAQELGNVTIFRLSCTNSPRRLLIHPKLSLRCIKKLNCNHVHVNSCLKVSCACLWRKLTMLRLCWCLGLSGCELKPQLRKITHCDANIQPSGILLCGIEATQLINMILAVGLRDKYFILSNTFPLFLGFLSSACCSELPRFAYCCLPVNCSLRCLHLRLFVFVCFVFFSVGSESQLRSDQFARHVWAKFALSHFLHRRSHWQEIQTGESKKRKLFSDIFD